MIKTDMEFIEAPAFTRNLRDYMDDEQYRDMQQVLAINPEMGDVMPGTSGLRKMRWADQRRGKGRRGGLRVIYYYFAAVQQIWLMTVYDKDAVTDLTPNEKKALRNAIQAEIAMRKQRGTK
jgi:hypothetical protein